MMENELAIRQEHSIEGHIGELSELLAEVVEDGASVGFLPPISRSEAAAYWSEVLKPDVLVFMARMNGRIVGSVQVHLCMKKNGGHRAEIAKLMTHPLYRRQGIGRALMRRAEEGAKQAERSLLVLDTREGDPSNALYVSMGYIHAGKIPQYAQSANGGLHATHLYYKFI